MSPIPSIVVAGTFDPSVFDKYFFIKNRVVAEEDLIDPFIWGPANVQLRTEKFYIVINPSQIIIGYNDGKHEDFKLNEMLTHIIIAANLSSIKAVGVNFKWISPKIEQNYTKFSLTTRSMFFKDDFKIFDKHFASEDSTFGSYASTTVHKARLKLDIKPIRLENPKNIQKPGYSVILSFNYHIDIPIKSAQETTVKNLRDYSVYWGHCNQIIKDYAE